jgi:hypothetical protein
MRLMFRGGGLVSTDTELAQACTKGLSALFKNYNEKMSAYEEKKEAKKRLSVGTSSASKKGPAAGKSEEGGIDAVDSHKPVLPMSSDNLRSLVQLLTVSIMEVTSSFQTAAFQLVREIVATRVLIPEIYDLATKLAEQIVLSQRKGVREAATSVVVTFIISYPLGEKRVSSQLKQLIVNCEYQFEEGRAAALHALVVLIKALPLPVLEEYAQTIFLPATLRVVNDKAAKCREQAAAVLVALVRKVSTETVLQFQEYVLKWLNSGLPSTDDASSSSTSSAAAATFLQSPAKALVRTGAQVAGLIIKARPDICKRDNHIDKLVQAVHYFLGILLTHSASSASAAQHLAHSSGSGSGSFTSSSSSSSLEKRELCRSGQEVEGQGADLGRADECWLLVYHLVCVCEQLYLNLPAAADYAITHLLLAATSASSSSSSSSAKNLKSNAGSEAALPLLQHNQTALMELVQESLLFPHAWVRAASVRVLLLYLRRRDVARLTTSPDGFEVLTAPNGMYQLARRLCVVLNQTAMHGNMLESVVACTVFTVRAMLHNPQLNQVSEELLAQDAARARAGAGEAGQRRRHRHRSSAAADGGGDGAAVTTLPGADSEDDDDSDMEDDDEEEEGEEEAEEAEVFDAQADAEEERARTSIQRAIEGNDDEEEENEEDDEEEEERDDVENSDKSDASDNEDGAHKGKKRKLQNPAATQPAPPALTKAASGAIAATGAGAGSAASTDAGAVLPAVPNTVGWGGAHWVMQRLRGIGANSIGSRRIHVIKVICF